MPQYERLMFDELQDGKPRDLLMLKKSLKKGVVVCLPCPVPPASPSLPPHSLPRNTRRPLSPFPGGNLWMAGDLDQTMYEWSGTSREFTLEFIDEMIQYTYGGNFRMTTLLIAEAQLVLDAKQSSMKIIAKRDVAGDVVHSNFWGAPIRSGKVTFVLARMRRDAAIWRGACPEMKTYRDGMRWGPALR